MLEFSGSRGVTLGYRPTVEQVDSDGQREMRLVARIGRDVPTPLPDRPSLSRLFARQRSAELWHGLYGLEVPSAAVEELDAVVRLRGEVRARPVHSGDILLFSPFARGRSRTWYLAHEVWHLVEAERDLLREYEPIREGTATFAAAVCLGRPEGERYLRPPEACTDIVSLRRTGVASIVAAFQLVGAPGLANELSGQHLAALETDLREHGLVLAAVEQREIG